jgi:CRISPR-associated protein Cmr1
MGEFILNFSGDGQTLSLLATLFLFLEKWGNIGAKPQLGYGIFEITNRSFVQNFAQHSWHDDMDIYKERADIDQKSSIDLPNLRRFGFLRYNFHPEKGTWWTHAPGLERVATNVQPIVKNFRTAPLAPPLKNEWRFRRWQRWHGGPIDQMLMFGAPQLRWKGETKRVRSKAAVSWAYPVVDGWEMRGWAWLHDQRVASKVWDLLRDESGWQAAIKVPGQMTLYPSGAWNEWTTNGVAEFLERTKW